MFPDFDDNLRQAFQHETELFFESIMREDRSVLDLMTADYTFVNERLAGTTASRTFTAAISGVSTLTERRAAGCSARARS